MTDVFNGTGPVRPMPPNTLGGLPIDVTAKHQSTALYGQLSWTPPIANDRLEVTVGMRHTRDDKDGERDIGGVTPFDRVLENSNHLITFNYNWLDTVATYAKWSTGFRSGGVNSRSTSGRPFDEEEVSSVEVGLKSLLWDGRLRVNAAAFRTKYEGLIIDVFDTSSATSLIVESINAEEDVRVDGAEIEMTLEPIDNLRLALSYTYLDGDMPLQPNPLVRQPTPPFNAQLEPFNLMQTPQHAGSLAIDYTFQPTSMGTVIAHMDIFSTDNYYYNQLGSAMRLDSYTLINAKLLLTGIPLGDVPGSLSASFWGKNLTDEEYIVSAFTLQDSIINAYGTPRVIGFDITYQF